jgi:predicted Fe-Mo cluster-binding NifX family protein
MVKEKSSGKRIIMKIAFITDDGKTISRHFGRAGHYLVVEVENGEEVSREMRDKLGHRNFSQAEEHHDHDQSGHSGMESHGKHMSMAEAIGDCQVLVCGGMGMGAYQSMQQLGITPIVTQESDIDAALEAYLKGDLKDHTEMLH